MKIQVSGILLTLATLMGACKQQPVKETAVSEDTGSIAPQAVSGNWNDLFAEIDPTEISDNTIRLISEDWMLVTAGNKEHFNTMTASWGAMGELWNRPAAFAFIRDSRYTFGFLQEDSCFTLSFYPESCREALQICGTKSGRDTDKVKESGLSPMPTPDGNMAFGEARMVIECKKMFVQRMDRNNFKGGYEQDIKAKFYNDRDSSDHFMFVGEIVRVWVKK